MPPASRRYGPDLAIELKGSATSYGAGEQISGRVVRQAHMVAPRGRVTVRLLGRSKVKMNLNSRIDGRTQLGGSKIYRSQFRFFSTETQQTLHDGPVHIPPDGPAGTWLFDINIPTTANPRVVKQGNQQEYSYLSLKDEDIVRTQLPATYHDNGKEYSVKFEAYVEYYLEAELLWEQGDSTNKATAVRLIVIRPASTPFPITDFALQTRSLDAAVSNARLLPGAAGSQGGLSFRQRAQRMLQSSNQPRFGYTIQVDCPAAMQLDSPVPVPFRLHIVPDAKRSSDDVNDAKVRPDVTLKSIFMKVTAVTSVVAPGLAAKDVNKTFDLGLINIPLKDPSNSEPIALPVGDDVQPLDVGTMLGLRLRSTGAGLVLRPEAAVFRERLDASFTTYNIKRAHSLQWAVVVVVAGQTVTHNGFHNVSLLPPSEDGAAD